VGWVALNLAIALVQKSPKALPTSNLIFSPVKLSELSLPPLQAVNDNKIKVAAIAID
jgi:hypothetical protein